MDKDVEQQGGRDCAGDVDEIAGGDKLAFALFRRALLQERIERDHV